MTTTKIYAIACASLTLAFTCLAQPDTASSKGSNAPYNEGPVWTLTMVKTKTGLGDEYLKQITGTVKPVYDEEKKQKVVLDYKILNGEASTPQDFNILIVVEYPSWAVFDNLRDKTDPHHRKGDGIRRSTPRHCCETDRHLRNPRHKNHARDYAKVITSSRAVFD